MSIIEYLSSTLILFAASFCFALFVVNSVAHRFALYVRVPLLMCVWGAAFLVSILLYTVMEIAGL